MSVEKAENGRRSLRLEVEVPGTPEEVWALIATGPGISSWFVPTVFREDGSIVSCFGPGMEAVTTLAEWLPPRRFVVEGADLGPDAPPVATEWSIETRSGDTCVVRLVQSLFADTDEWDDQLASFESGWTWFFRVLQLSLTHFRNQPCAPFRAMSLVPGQVAEVWVALTHALGLENAEPGQPAQASAEVPPLAGLVTRKQTEGGGHPHGLQLLLDAPTSGIAALFAHTCGESVLVVLDLYLYGPEAAVTAARDEPRWRAWMADHFPAVGAE